MGDSLPQVAPGELLMQKSPTVKQRADAEGNWSRETDAAITDKSVSRHVSALESTTDLARENKRVSEHSSVEVDGASTLEVGTQLTMLAGKRADLGTLGAMNLTAGGNSTHSTGKNAAETVGGNHTSRVKQNREIAVEGGRTEEVSKGQVTTIGKGRNEKVGADQVLEVGGSNTESAGGNKLIEAANITLKAKGKLTCISEQGGGSVSLYNELLLALDDIKAALDVLATHDHPDAGTINQGGAVAGHSAGLGGHRKKMGDITG